MHLVGSIIRIYHDARSPERQNVDRLWIISLFVPLIKYKQSQMGGERSKHGTHLNCMQKIIQEM